MLSTTSLLLAAALAASLGAQVCHYNLGQDAGEQPGDTQRHGFFAESGSILGLRTQAIVPRFAFPNAPVLISSVFVAPAAYGYFRFASLQVKLGYTSRDALTTIFADNPAGSLTTVLDLREHTLWCRRSTWTEIGLQQPFLYVPAIGNLLIEVVAIRPDASPPPMLWTGSHANEQSVSASFAGTRLPTGGSVTAALPKLALCAERAS